MSRRSTIAIALAIFAALTCAASASAAVRTGSTTTSNGAKPTPGFPGLQQTSVLYDEATTELTVTAQLRSPLADSAATSALRKTSLTVRIGSSWGETGAPYGLATGCGVSQHGFSFDVALADLSVSKVDFKNGHFVNTTIGVAQLSASRDVATVQLNLGSLIKEPNPICVSATLDGAGEIDMSENLLDGFTWSDGDVASVVEFDFWQALNRLALVFGRGLYDDLYDTHKLTCAATNNALAFKCLGIVRMRSPGRPLVTVRGLRKIDHVRTKTIADSNAPVTFFALDNHMNVKLRWRKCPRKYKNNRGQCPRSAKWRGSGDLGDAVARVLH